MTSQIYFCGALLWGSQGITRVVLNRFGRIPFLGFDRVGDWPNVWTTGIWTHWNGFGFDFWPRPNKGKFEATGAAGFKASYVVSFTVPYNGGLDPAGTRRKFVSLKFGNAGYGIPKVKAGSGRIWHSLFSTCQSNMMAGVMTSLVMSYLRIEPTVTLDSDSRFPRHLRTYDDDDKNWKERTETTCSG